MYRSVEHKETILLVEDNPKIMSLLISMFEDHYEVFTAVDGEKGLSCSFNILPDLVITDNSMPTINGIALCKSIKSNLASSHIPVILLTAESDLEAITEGLRAGANICLTKPFEKKHLYYSVSNLLSVNKKNRTNFLKQDYQLSNKLDQEFIHLLDKVIEENLMSHAFNLDFIAAELKISVPTVYRKLKTISSLSINNYVKIYRLNKAKSLLNGSMMIKDVAYAVGFSDRKYFSKEFKKHFGYSPSEHNDS